MRLMIITLVKDLIYEDKAGNARIVDSQTLPDKAHDYRLVRDVVAFIEESFDKSRRTIKKSNKFRFVIKN